MIHNDPKKDDSKINNEDAAVKPDPETLGPEPQEHMDGPISTIIRKLSENMDEDDERATDVQDGSK